ncbi:hypothetical protein Hydth_1745 [Hydrogenobacter thermophilus TK-6]|uniref:Uncharacterized protein n=1 Tax=Hydrogenobacter thermophilus (strain DSM 6534 / IAM 12695 / TK-6) TaxID=608538 RepID=D3DK55_HYDTT|nr:hypothetical protein [Hydrogenobacter thermophilus]ADO46126.1 hypothetical protein Hydth_1745 [Hydrogenobacter thermophilus TK-6]BAI70207.1 hypothetical protein HTH_1763 [Hydrogenobacter thermophilus TK-6]
MKVYPTAEVIDGAGVRIRRYIGTMHIGEPIWKCQTPWRACGSLGTFRHEQSGGDN